MWTYPKNRPIADESPNIISMHVNEQMNPKKDAKAKYDKILFTTLLLNPAPHPPQNQGAKFCVWFITKFVVSFLNPKFQGALGGGSSGVRHYSLGL
jgi:hypothetical protein